MRDDARSASLVLDRLYYRAKEVAVLTGLGLRTIYAGVYSGSIPSRKIGNSRLIPAAWILADQHAADEMARQAPPSEAPPGAGRRRKLRYSVDDTPRHSRGVSRFLRLFTVS